MSGATFRSYSQNGEDVVLSRALRDVELGRYIDVGANDPAKYSVSRAFYERGWSGITVEPDPDFADRQRRERPRDVLVTDAVTDHDRGEITFYVVDGTGLSTTDRDLALRHQEAGYPFHEIRVGTRTLDSLLDEHGWQGSDIHFMSVDVEGAEPAVMRGIDLTKYRPWVLLVESTAPLSTARTVGPWESQVLDAGYRRTLFDGLSTFFVAEEHADQLAERLSFPACPLDDYQSWELWNTYERLAEVSELRAQTIRWRSAAASRWATALAQLVSLEDTQAELEKMTAAYHEMGALHHDRFHEAAALRAEIAQMTGSTSWRITEPLRHARRRLRPPRRAGG